jgi:hypothetical protein
VFQVAEHATGIQASEDFGIEVAFARVNHMVNGETGDDRIE